MPKPDYKHDYYADLELRADASADDIKKSFKKLARLYHPDRNPGQQDEFVPKFQAIQAAHEILNDTELRAKYDADRRKYGYSSQFPRPPAPRGMHSMYQTNTAFPAPPTRRGAAPARPEFHTSHTTGPERWTNFPRPPTAQRPPAAPPRGEQPNNLKEAWGHVRPQRPPPTPARPQPQTQPPPPPQTTSDNESAYARQRRPTQNFDTYAGFANVRPSAPPFSRSNTVRVPKKGGFDPNAREGDEGQAKATGYTSNNRYSFRGAPAPPPEAPEPPSTHHNPPQADSFATFPSHSGEDIPFAEGTERVRTPYSGMPGGFSSADIRRSATERQARTRSHERSRSKQASPVNLNRPRSASPGLRKPVAPSPPRTQPQAPPKRGGNARRPFARDSAGREDYDSSSGEETIFNGRRMAQPSASRQAKSKLQQKPSAAAKPAIVAAEVAAAQTATEQPPPNLYDPLPVYRLPRSRSLSHHFFSKSSNIPKSKYSLNFQRSSSDNAMGAPKGPKATHKTEIPLWAYPSSVPPAPSSQIFPASLPSNLRNSFGSTFSTGTWPPLSRSVTSPIPNGPRRVEGGWVRKNSAQSVDIWSAKRPSEEKHSFNMPPPPPPQRNPSFKSRSEESLNQRFSPQDWQEFTQPGAGFFDLPTAPDQTPRKPSPAPPSRSRNSSKPPEMGQRATFLPQAGTNGIAFGIPGFTNIPPPPPGPPPNLATHPRVNANRNTHTSPQASYFPPPPPTPGSSGRVGFSESEWGGAFNPNTFAFPPKPPSPVKRGPPPGRKTRSGTKSANDPRPPVTSSTNEIDEEKRGSKSHSGTSADDEESHDGDAMDLDEEMPSFANGVGTDTTKEARSVPLAPSRPEWRDTTTYREAPSIPLTPPSASSTMKSAFARSMPVGSTAPTEPNPLQDLKNVAPIASNTTDGFDGMNKDLNSALPFTSTASTSHPLTAEDIEQLDFPPPPLAPDIGSTGKLTAERWSHHCTLMSAYFAKWYHFHAAMVAHLATREAQIKSLVGTAWLSAGDGAGFESYMKGLKQDVKFREWFNTAVEKHVEAMEGFEKLRERVRKGGLRSEV